MLDHYKTKMHDQELKGAILSLEVHFPLISGPNAYQIVCSTWIDFSEILCSMQLVE